jgi:hypothetical protein
MERYGLCGSIWFKACRDQLLYDPGQQVKMLSLQTTAEFEVGGSCKSVTFNNSFVAYLDCNTF